MKVAVRTDASRRIGWGHLKRCLSLAQALRERGDEVAFVARPADVDVASLLAQAGFAALPMPRIDDGAGDDPDETPPPHGAWLERRWDRDATDTTCAVHAWGPDVVLVDHYGIDARWHSALGAATGATIAVIDDLADRPLATELVIDHNPAADHAAKYRGVLRYPAGICGGPSYALLDAVYRDHARCVVTPQVTSIGVFMGGTDPGNFSAFAVNACRQDAGWTGPIEIATTSANPSLPLLQALAAADAQLHIVLDQPHLADFHARHGLQIGAGGGALWERCSLGTPTIALITADNQRLSVPLLAADGVVVGLDAIGQGADVARALGSAVRRLLDAPDERRALHQSSIALVDGHGAARAAAAIAALRPSA
ncbi:UDP-2,4-diacetamido-2,4,6-trideoxy-beta-L-altropyranose hydrolase [Aquabacterium humicola]|uniref:UDP-2,4-diacetamido-2,4, 6-trideoxy-beta-L-altropyranose hydrolase n=1 Tax=Aquabacterium humicola TaxID=3237377 RepID=UPI002542E861|nr:UDP-2,4-diacetamido-2,4,6-trideoxy-beta-L-altropyranose hydrolase [Rubrivivax pictus]